MLPFMFAGTIVLAILATGDIVSVLTKAKIPMMFVALGLYLVLTWLGMPQDYPMTSNFAMFGMTMLAPLIVNMATIVPLKDFAKQWRAIIVSLFGIIVAVILILAVSFFTFGYEKGIAGSGALCGSLVAAVITTDALKSVGMGALCIIPLAIVAIQEPIGQIVAINMLKKHAVNIYDSVHQKAAADESDSLTSDNEDKKTHTGRQPLIPEKYETPFVALLKLVAIACLGVFVGEKTALHWAINCLLFGIIAVYLGILRPKMLDRAESSGITMACILIYVFTQMNEVTPEVFGTEVVSILTILVVGIIGLAIGGMLGGKLVGWKTELSMAVALTALFGFPGNYIITQEVCRTVGKTEAEQEKLMDEMLAPMLIGGYTTVTVGSLLIASFLVQFL